MILAFLVALSTVQAPAGAAPEETAPPPVLREVVLEGVSYFNRDQVLNPIRAVVSLRGGGPAGDLAEVAASLAPTTRPCFLPCGASRFDAEAAASFLTVYEGDARLLSTGSRATRRRSSARCWASTGTPLATRSADAMARFLAST